MAESGDLLNLVHNVSSISVDFKAPTGVFQEQGLVGERQTVCDLEGDNAIDDNIKYNDTAIEPPPLRSNSSRYNQYRKIKIRKENYHFKHHTCVLNCNQNQCPALRERLEHHRSTHYRRGFRGQPSKKFKEQGVNVTPTLSEVYLAQSTIPILYDGKSVQTDITLEDFILQHESVTHTFNYLKDSSLKGSDTQEVLSGKNVYKEHLQNEILDWLRNVPIFYSLDFTAEYLKDNFVTIFVDRIAQLVKLVYENDYKPKLRTEIEDCLNILPMWLPNSRKEQVMFKNSLRDRLYAKIENVNNTFYGTNVKHGDTNDCDDHIKKTSMENEFEKENELSRSNSLYAKIVASFLSRIKFNKSISKKLIIVAIVKRISSLLNVPQQNKMCKTELKSKIFEILNDLPMNMFGVKNRNLYINRCSDDLANRLLSARLKIESSEKCVAEKFVTQFSRSPINNNKLKQVVHETINKALGKVTPNKKNEIEREICDVIFNSLETLRSGIENNISNDICDTLCRTCNITEERAIKVSRKLKLYIKIALKHDKASNITSFHSIKPQLSEAMAVYRSSESGPVTSTPKKLCKKCVPRLNSEERAYMENVANLIRSWMELLPKKFDDDKQYKDTIINDLAGDIMDEVKREQLSETDTEKEKHITYFMYRWLSRFEIFDDLNEATSIIEDFLIRLKEIPEPQLTAPQQGTRQAMNNLNYAEKVNGWNEDFVPRGIDILEDQISVWMNELPPEIFITDPENDRHKEIKDLAIKLEDHLQNKHTEDKITDDINNWLIHMIKPQEKEHLGLLTDYLKDIVLSSPQDETLEAKNQKRKRQRAEYLHSIASPVSDDIRSVQEDSEQTMKEFILKYVEHNYDIDDPMAKGAFCQLLKTELRKLSPLTRQKLYDNFTTDEQFASEKFANELEYISMISDWLKNIPINPLYNTPGNRARVDFVNDLAKNIQEAEEQRKEYSDGMDYDLFLSSIISISLRTYNIPILPEHKNSIPLMINQLLSKIMAKRSIINQPKPESSEQQNLSDLIDQYIEINKREITDDEIKQEAWTARLLKEVNKVVHDDTDPPKLCKDQMYDKLSQVPVAGQDSVRRFSLEMKYVKEISDWLKNLPVLPITDLPRAEKERINMISELAERISDIKAATSSDPNHNTSDNKLVQYITTWVSKLNLDPRKNLVIPIVIQQLINRVENIDKKDLTLFDTPEHKEIITLDELTINEDVTKNPGTHLVEAVEKWCHNLPIEGNDQEIVQMKQDLAKQLYQKIGELNIDPKIYNDNALYKNLLEDAIDTLLENLPQNSDLQNNRSSLKAELLHTILTMKRILEQNFTGDNYKHKLEMTIDAAIPNPIQNRQIIEPGFEIYKRHLANMFILENFDHSDDDVKTKYEKRIRDEVDKYFESAQNRNALPMTRAQMYNELYSELFKVPMPSEESVVDQVEEVKTRCEIDAWLDDVPLKEASTIGEYLERDQILSTLAKRIHEIEKHDSIQDEKIRSEISKWLQKLPLLSKTESETNIYIEKLQNALKTSEEARKYVAAKPEGVIDRLKTKQNTKSQNTSHIVTNDTESKKCVCVATAYKRAGDLIVEIVDNWCDELKLRGNEIQNNMTKDDLSTKLVMKICELNMDARILNDEIVYDQLLLEELDKYMSELPIIHDLGQSGDDKKNELIEKIRLIKPLIKEGIKKHEYKAELNNTVSRILNGHGQRNEKALKFEKLKEEIIDNFIQFNYNIDDDEGRQIYKKLLFDAVNEFLADDVDMLKQLSPLILSNRLLCELTKISIPSTSLLKDDVDEIKMKNEIEQLFEDNSLDDNTVKTSQIKKALAKRLNDIEKSGHCDYNDDKMCSEIARCLTKLNKEIKPESIQEFVNILKNNETDRKKPSVNKTNGPEKSGNVQQNIVHPSQLDPHQRGQFLQVPTIFDQSHCRSDQQWGTLKSATPRKEDTVYNEPSNFHNIGRPESFRQGSVNMSPIPFDTEYHNDIPNYLNIQNGTAGPRQNFIPDGNNNIISDRIPPYNFDSTRQYTGQSPNQLPQHNFESRSNKPLYSPKLPQYYQDRPLNYNKNERKRSRSYGIADPYGNVSQTNINGGPSSAYISPYEPSVSADQGSISESTNYRKVVTPRRVQGEAHEFVPSLTPTTAPKRFSSPLSVLSRNASGSSRGFRPSIPSGRSSRLYCPVMGSKMTSRIVDPTEEMSSCVCDKRNKRWKRGPYCMIPAEEFCEECGGFTPTWYRMPVRGYFYMQCI